MRKYDMDSTVWYGISDRAYGLTLSLVSLSIDKNVSSREYRSFFGQEYSFVKLRVNRDRKNVSKNKTKPIT